MYFVLGTSCCLYIPLLVDFVQTCALLCRCARLTERLCVQEIRMYAYYKPGREVVRVGQRSELRVSNSWMKETLINCTFQQVSSSSNPKLRGYHDSRLVYLFN